MTTESDSVERGGLSEAVEQFLLSRRVGNCTARTLDTYTRNLQRFTNAVGAEPGAWTPSAVQRYLSSLREHMKPVSAHQHFRTLRTFFRWCVDVDLLSDNPMRGLTMKTPKTFPRVPEDAEVNRLLNVCPRTWEGVRNAALVALLVDSALRISEALRLCIEDLILDAQTLRVRLGKGQKDRVGFFGTQAAEYLKAWLTLRGECAKDSFVFCTRNGRPLAQSHATHVLHRLSVRASLPKKIGPHALRHYAATSLLRQTGDLELVRRVLGHESLTMALKYAHMTGADIAAKFRRASPLDHLCASRGRHVRELRP